MSMIIQRHITMNQIYPMMIDNNIMSDLSDFDVPWKSDIESGVLNQAFLDLGYYSHSANKLITQFMLDVSGNDGSTPLTNEQRTKIAGVISNIYKRKWDRLWAIYDVEYNPISNYDMTETESITSNGSSSGTETGTITKDLDNDTTNSRTEGGTRNIVTDNESSQTGTVRNDGSNNVENGIFGFNSSSSVGSDDSTSTATNTRTDNLANSENTTETETRNLTDNSISSIDETETETRNLSDSRTNTKTDNRTLSRSGNIGVTTSQQMIMSEIELWKWNFFKDVFEDIDSICCLNVY